jgi:hypothetical protein
MCDKGSHARAKPPPPRLGRHDSPRGLTVSSASHRPPAWTEFAERPAAEFEFCSPEAEFAAILQRFRDALDEAGRAGAESRVHGLRALAEQAVLAVELEKLLELRDTALEQGLPESAHLAIARIKDQMLAHIAASGLEIVRLSGAGARDVADVAEVDCWRYDAMRTSPVVVQELEAAVRLDGAPLRRGRVVMGGQREAVVWPPPVAARPAPREPAPGGASDPAPVAAPAAAARIICPIDGCGAENPVSAEACVGCLTPLAGFGRMSMHCGALFNQGLRAARGGRSAAARECFAAVVLWHPGDITTRNAHALACLDNGDVGAARRGWEEVLARAPGDALAVRGLAALREV